MKNVLLVFGGASYEHDISVITAIQIYKKTKLKDVKLNLLYISRDEKFYICDEKKVVVDDFSKANFNGNPKKFKEVFFVSGEKQKLFVKTHFGLKEYMQVSVAVFACHGGNGENGKLVSYFDYNGIACSAGSSDALAICMDKFIFKKVAKGLGIPVVQGFRVNKIDYKKNLSDIMKRLKIMKFPVIIKSNSGGSSIGVFVANDIDEFHSKIKEVFELDESAIVEKYIEHTREFNIAVMGDKEKFEISKIDEPIKNDDLLSFSDKYLSGNSKSKKGQKSMDNSLRKFPADISEKLSKQISQIARKVFLSLNLQGIVRIDFLYQEKQDKLYICEVNAIPGSLAYYFFKRNYIVTNDLIERLIDIAEKNYRPKIVNSSLIVDVLIKK